MQLAGPWVMGPPADHDGALAVLREAVGLGITHIDTSDAYGPRITNQLIREALHPYPESLFIATKVGATRDAQGGWPTARRPEDLRQQVQENLDSSVSRPSTWSTCAWVTPRAPGRTRSPRRSRHWPPSSRRV
ncbi:hypothetical protein SHKM778_80620 [Streptomyces sp. KM77-8]|uniref:NADP-dependent oxidoreductase domain-containing protein n=1 Tax=Streptomyces haneummycinicus TaxID=3074435 RepID=A0AAT9HWC1_9ACTN